jgi:hypothetical protein
VFSSFFRLRSTGSSPAEDFFMRHAAARLVRRLPLLVALALLPAARAADDVVAEEKPPIGFGEAAVGEDVEPAPDAKNPLAGYLSALADGPVVLAWKEGRLIVDVPATQAALHGEDFARMRQAVENTLDRAGKLLVEEGVAQGLPRDQAEMLFGGAREKLAADPNDAMGFPLGPRMAQPLFRAVGPAEVAETAFRQALDKAVAQGHIARDGGESSSATGASRETTHQRGQFRLRMRARPGDWSAAAADGSRSLSFAVAAEPRLTLRLGAGGEFGDDDGDGDEEGETVLVKQTAKAFRARIVRAGKEVLNLEAGSFRDCCRTQPEAVRRELAPLLKRIGIRLPPMPDDAAVKTEVVARLRKAAGTDQPGGAKEVAPAALEARKQRAAQLVATIDAFGLLDDRRYLEDLKPTAAPEDARAIDARLATLAASAGK